jgi:hypothetical protein
MFMAQLVKRITYDSESVKYSFLIIKDEEDRYTNSCGHRSFRNESWGYNPTESVKILEIV